MIIRRLVLVAAGCGVIGAANAGLTVYNSQSAWQTATGPYSTVDFEGVSLPPIPDNWEKLPAGTYTIGAVTFTTSTAGSNTYIIGDGFYSSQANFSSQQSASGDNGTTVSIPSSTSFGLDLGTVRASGSVIVTFSNGDGASISGFDYHSEFVGFTDSTPFTSVNFEQVGETPHISGVQVGPVYYGAATPEPFTLALCAGGLGLAFARRRRRA